MVMLKIISRFSLIYLVILKNLNIIEVPHITNESPAEKNNLLNLLRNREYLKNGY